MSRRHLSSTQLYRQEHLKSPFQHPYTSLRSLPNVAHIPLTQLETEYFHCYADSLVIV